MEKNSNDACVVGVYETLEGAERAVHILSRANHPAGQVSLVAEQSSFRPEVIQELRLGDDSLRDAAIAGGLGSVVGVLAGTGLLVFSGGTAVLLVGPIAGAVVGSIVGAFLGGMWGWGVHESHIQQYEKQVGEGKALVIANGTPEQLEAAERILQETGAAKVHLHARNSDDAPEITG